jgi:hypothetical protein
MMAPLALVLVLVALQGALTRMVELPAQERISSSVNVVTNVVGFSADVVAISLEFVGDRPICGAVRPAASV